MTEYDEAVIRTRLARFGLSAIADDVIAADLAPDDARALVCLAWCALDLARAGFPPLHLEPLLGDAAVPLPLLERVYALVQSAYAASQLHPTVHH